MRCLKTDLLYINFIYFYFLGLFLQKVHGCKVTPQQKFHFFLFIKHPKGVSMEFLAAAIVTSLKIVFVWAAMQPGMILFPLNVWLSKLLELFPVTVSLFLMKPLFDCLFCMSSFWGIVFSLDHFAFTWSYLSFLFTVGAINYIIQILISYAGSEE